jgi:hypothetical protein
MLEARFRCSRRRGLSTSRRSWARHPPRRCCGDPARLSPLTNLESQRHGTPNLIGLWRSAPAVRPRRAAAAALGARHAYPGLGGLLGLMLDKIHHRWDAGEHPACACDPSHFETSKRPCGQTISWPRRYRRSSLSGPQVFQERRLASKRASLRIVQFDHVFMMAFIAPVRGDYRFGPWRMCCAVAETSEGAAGSACSIAGVGRKRSCRGRPDDDG